MRNDKKHAIAILNMSVEKSLDSREQYGWEKMPNGNMVGCCSTLVNVVSETYEKDAENSNAGFMEAEEYVRKYVWAECQKAYRQGLEDARKEEQVNVNKE